ncbi:MAG: alanine/glycine:cation symporter family protein, partial [Verrucomicrobiales bacterium]
MPVNAESSMSIDQKIDQVLEPAANVAESVVFWSMPIGGGKAIPLVLIILGTTALFLTIYFRFINFRALGIAARTITGKYTTKDAPGQITHFQALSAALSATVGLGNIAGVAVAIAIGGPGATFWMILVGLCGMTTKFTECTLGVKYRKVDPDGKTRGGAMYYLQDGLKEMGMAKLGKFLAILFAIFCVAGAIGAGNMFQANQAHQQFSDTFGILEQGWQFGLIVALVVGFVIIGGIVWIARVTSFLVPFMCAGYMLAAVTVLIVNAGEIPSSIELIFTEAFSGSAAVGGVIGAIIQGIKRGVFSNEAGVGSAPIAHSAVKTDRPASEGLVALLEPFIDTVIVCTMTALVIISSGMWNVKADAINQLDIVTAPESQSIVSTVETGTQFN